MPLITISGIPLSGKTTRAKQLKVALESLIANTNRKILIVNEESLLIDKKVAYKDGHAEKKHRGAILSAIERHLDQENIVICDSLNYIKGFRYQLFCVARGIGTTCCTVYCGMTEAEALARNNVLNIYPNHNFENLCSRFEEPDSRNRWDAPLFLMISEDPPLSVDSPMVIDIVNAIILKKNPKPNLSTISKPIQQTNYLHELDKTTGDIIEAFMDAQKQGRVGELKVPNIDTFVCLPSRIVTIAELRRLKRQFLNINKSHQLDVNEIASTFTDYLNTNLE